MTDAELWRNWTLWMAVAAAIASIAAALLIAILVASRGILAEAVRAHAAIVVIQRQTSAILRLERTNDTAAAIRDAVRVIAAKSASLAALKGHIR